MRQFKAKATLGQVWIEFENFENKAGQIIFDEVNVLGGSFVVFNNGQRIGSITRPNRDYDDSSHYIFLYGRDRDTDGADSSLGVKISKKQAEEIEDLIMEELERDSRHLSEIED